MTKYNELVNELAAVRVLVASVLNKLDKCRVDLNTLDPDTTPEEPVDWDSLIDDAEGAEAYAREALETAERSSQEAEELESSVTEMVGYAEQAMSNCDDTVSSYRDLADTLRRAKEQHSGE